MSNPTKSLKVTNNGSYIRAIPKWQTVRDALEGETAIKAGSTRYLPMPAAMLRKTDSSAPSYAYANETYAYDRHENMHYAAYKMRARFPELTDATLRGIIGLILRNPSAYNNLPYPTFVSTCTPDDKTLQELEIQLNTEVMTVGRVGILTDIGSDLGEKPKIIVYKTEDILNWQTEGNSENIKFTGVLLRDTPSKKDFWQDASLKETRLLLYINDEGFYSVAKYIENDLVEITTPTYMGKPLTYIPFITIGTKDLTPDIDNPPMWPLANISVKIYQISADLRNAQYMSCNPMLTVSGIDPTQVPSAIGSNVALILPDALAKAYYPKTDTTALEHVRMYIKDLQAEAIRLGANLLGNENTLAESGEAIRLRQSMAAATVASVVANTGKGLQRLIHMIADWMGINDRAEILVNKEFSSFQMTANEQIALIQSWQAGALSTLTMLENFRRAGMLQEGEDALTEIERLKVDTLRLKALGTTNEPLNTGPKGGAPKGSQPDTRVKT